MSEVSKPTSEQVTVTHMDLIEHRLSTTTDKPNGIAWFNAYQIDVRHLLEQLEAAQALVEMARNPDRWDEFLVATSNPAIKPESPCSICRSYGHFTHNHPEGYVNPMYDALDPARELAPSEPRDKETDALLAETGRYRCRACGEVVYPTHLTEGWGCPECGTLRGGFDPASRQDA